LSEVPLGEGIVDLKRAVTAIQRSRPRTRFTLEMITRNPLDVPCLTDKYWATFPDRSGKRLAETLRLARDAAARLQHLPRVDGENRQGLVQLEEENIKQCLHYARTQMGL